MKRIWMFAIAAFCLSGNSAIADDTELNACANLLFVNAFEMYTAAANLQGNPRDQELSNIFDILSENKNPRRKRTGYSLCQNLK